MRLHLDASPAIKQGYCSCANQLHGVRELINKLITGGIFTGIQFAVARGSSFTL